MRPARVLCAWVGLLAVLAQSGCGKSRAGAEHHATTVIQNIGSDTMVNLAQAWAEAYGHKHKDVSVEVSGGGSGVGVAALLNGTADIANCSRHLEPKELALAKKQGEAPKEILVGFDGLALYVHKNNPIEQLSLEELAELFREHGSIDSWKQLGVEAIPGARTDRVIRVSRQNNSGTYHYFRETVLGKKADMKPGSLDMNGSKEVVELVSQTPGAIGYSGLGYATSKVKVLKISKRKGEPGVMPSRTSIHDKSYPISRPLFMVTPSTPKPSAQAYLDFVLSPEGQELVLSTGYVPLS